MEEVEIWDNNAQIQQSQVIKGKICELGKLNEKLSYRFLEHTRQSLKQNDLTLKQCEKPCEWKILKTQGKICHLEHGKSLWIIREGTDDEMFL